jgi:hypothetical protein
MGSRIHLACRSGSLLAGRLAHVNLIPLNPTPGSRWTASDPAVAAEFEARLARPASPVQSAIPAAASSPLALRAPLRRRIPPRTVVGLLPGRFGWREEESLRGNAAAVEEEAHDQASCVFALRYGVPRCRRVAQAVVCASPVGEADLGG